MEQKNVNFFNKKRTVLLSLSFLVLVALVAVTLSQILNLDFYHLFKNISLAANENPLFSISLVILLFGPLFKTMNLYWIYFYEMKRRKIYTSQLELFTLCFIYNFIVSITPSSIGGEPWLMYWLRKKDIPLNEANAFVLYSSTVGHAAASFITWPSLIYFIVTIYDKIYNYQFIIWFTSIGMAMETVVLIVFIVMSFSPKIQYLVSLIFNKILKFLNLKYKDRNEIKKEYEDKKIFKLMMINYYKNYLFTTFIFLLSLFYNFVLYVIYYFSINFCFADNVNFMDSFNAVNISITANNFIPLPGSEGSLQVLMQKILQISLPNISLQNINDGIFVWRFSTTYLTSIIGIIFIFIYLKNILDKKKNSKLNMGNKSNKILIIQNRSHNTIGGIEKYNRNLIEIFIKMGIDVHELPLVRDQDVDKSKFISDKEKSTLVTHYNNDYYEKTKKFELIDSLPPIKQFPCMKSFVKFSRKIVKEHLEKNSYDLIIDSTFFGMPFLFENDNYVWVQHNSRKSRNGMIYNNPFMNFLGFIGIKLLGVSNTFKKAKNVVLYDEENEKDVNYKWKKFYKIPLFYDGKWITKIPKNKDKIVFIGRLEKDQKRCDLLIKVANKLQSKIYVYGDGEYKEKIKSNKNIVYCGKFNKNNINDVFSDKMLTILLSNHEGFSFTLVESLSNATPILVRNTFPSAKFFVDNGKNGILIDKRKSSTFIAKTINDYINKNQKDKMQENSFSFAKNNFKKEKFVKSWIKLYNDLSKK